jgi:succinate dehydrogenase hydrophobic anchor subunit
MKLWVMRIIGALNILFTGLGVYYFVAMIGMRWRKWPGPPSQSAWAIYILLSAISLSFLAFLGYAGVKLIKVDESVLRPLGVTFILELLFVIAIILVDWTVLPAPIAKIAVGFWEGGIDPLTPQFLTGYPLVGAVAVLLLSMKKKRPSRPE